MYSRYLQEISDICRRYLQETKRYLLEISVGNICRRCMQETTRYLQEISVYRIYLQEISEGDVCRRPCDICRRYLYLGDICRRCLKEISICMRLRRYLEENMRNLQDTMGYFLFVVPCLALLQNINIIVHAAYFKTSLKQYLLIKDDT